MDIEDVAKEHPEEIETFPIDFAQGMTNDLAKKICKYLKVKDGAQTEQGIDQLKKLYSLFLKVDAA